MKKLFLLFLLTYTMLEANTKSALYEVSFSFLGTMGKVEMTKTIVNNDYVISVHAYTVGLVASLTKNREETYISQGKITNGIYIPDVFVKIRITDNKENYTVYKFGHKNKKIHRDLLSIKTIREQSFDVRTMRIISSKKREEEISSRFEDVYADNDLISFIFNASHHLPRLKEGSTKKFYAVAVNTEESAIYLEKPHANTVVDNVPKNVIREGKLFEIVLKKKFFKDGEGKIEVAVDEDGFPLVAVMNNVALFGDVVGQRVENE